MAEHPPLLLPPDRTPYHWFSCQTQVENERCPACRPRTFALRAYLREWRQQDGTCVTIHGIELATGAYDRDNLLNVALYRYDHSRSHMATIEEVIQRWMIEAGRETPHFLHSSTNMLVTHDETGTLYYDRDGRGRGGWGRLGRYGPQRGVALARYIGNRYKGGCCLLNGDGFEDPDLQNWQARIRDAANREFTWQRCAVVPYAALDAAQIDYNTIRLIEVTQDQQDMRTQTVEGLDIVGNNGIARTKATLDAAGFQPVPSTTGLPDNYLDRPGTTFFYAGRAAGQRIRLDLAVLAPYDRTGQTHFRVDAVYVWAQPTNGRPGWQILRNNGGRVTQLWQWVERIHRLGSAVFYGHGPDGRTHRWISAFDQNEPTPLYFLAQLPDRGKIRSYGDAIEALAPPIVHKSIADGRHVVRQGDVFAIETNLTDEQVYADATTRVRREVAIQNPGPVRGPHELPTTDEVRENGTCSVCNCRPKIGNGPRARQALSIFRTGHSASEVVVKSDGRTFIRGQLFHDPVLETEGRAPEHQVVALHDGPVDGPIGQLVSRQVWQEWKWYLAVRNTVPRQRVPRDRVVEQQDTAAARRVIATQDADARGRRRVARRAA